MAALRWLAGATVVAVAVGVGSVMASASPSEASSAVRQAFAAHRFVSGSPHEVGRVRGSHGFLVLWASPASGGGWCQGLQRPRGRFTRMSVSCIWPRSSLRHRIDLTTSWPNPFLFYGRVPQKSAQTLRLRLTSGRSVSVAMRNGFFLFRIPDSVLAHALPRALIAYDARGRLVARAATPSGFAALNSFGGIRRPPGGAALKQKRQLVSAATAVGPASIWVAPDKVSPAHCSWLEIRRAVYGGSCLRNHTLRRGLPEVVPLVLPIDGRSVPLLWGHSGINIARLSIIFQDGSRTNLSHRDGVFLYPVPRSRWSKGHRPAFLVAHDQSGRIISKRLLYEYTLAP
jgi:hypothetical protein